VLEGIHEGPEAVQVQRADAAVLDEPAERHARTGGHADVEMRVEIDARGLAESLAATARTKG
jgi:hypothetical protein